MVISKKGMEGAYTKPWTRLVDEEGTFRWVGTENGPEYLKAMKRTIQPTCVLLGSKQDYEQTMKGARMAYTNCGGDSWHFTKILGGKSSSFKYNMNEEIDYDALGWERTMVCTRLAYTNI